MLATYKYVIVEFSRQNGGRVDMAQQLVLGAQKVEYCWLPIVRQEMPINTAYVDKINIFSKITFFQVTPIM